MHCIRYEFYYMQFQLVYVKLCSLSFHSIPHPPYSFFQLFRLFSQNTVEKCAPFFRLFYPHSLNAREPHSNLLLVKAILKVHTKNRNFTYEDRMLRTFAKGIRRTFEKNIAIFSIDNACTRKLIFTTEKDDEFRLA